MQSKTWKRIENGRIFTFQAFVKKANHLALFDDWEHQSRNFTVSIMVVSIFYSTSASLSRVAFIKVMRYHKMRASFLAYAGLEG